MNEPQNLVFRPDVRIEWHPMGVAFVSRTVSEAVGADAVGRLLRRMKSELKNAKKAVVIAELPNRRMTVIGLTAGRNVLLMDSGEYLWSGFLFAEMAGQAAVAPDRAGELP